MKTAGTIFISMATGKIGVYVQNGRMKIAEAISYENDSGIFIRRACCEIHQPCFHIRGQMKITEAIFIKITGGGKRISGLPGHSLSWYYSPGRLSQSA